MIVVFTSSCFCGAASVEQQRGSRMPWVQRMAEIANARFSRERISDIDLAWLAPGTGLAEIADKLEIATTPPERQYLSSWPVGQQEALRAAIYSALNREPRLPVTFMWAPGYDYELSIFETAGTAESRGGMSIL